jgi:hypothetical protein
MPDVVVCVTVIWFVVLLEIYVVAMFVAAEELVAAREQCPLEVIPVTVTLSLDAEVVVRDTGKTGDKAVHEEVPL